MTLFSKVAIPMSLTELDPVLSKEATQLFKCLLMYSGERPNPYPPAMALQVLQAGVAQPELRPEIYFQLMKQLRSNPSADSQRRYWELMALALMSFPPGSGCDDYVHVFLKGHADGAQRYVPPQPSPFTVTLTTHQLTTHHSPLTTHHSITLTLILTPTPSQARRASSHYYTRRSTRAASRCQPPTSCRRCSPASSSARCARATRWPTEARGYEISGTRSGTK